MPAALVIRVNARDLQHMYADLRAAGGQLNAEFRRAVVKAAEPLKQAVQEEASWSTRIPAAVKTKVSFSARRTSVQIVVDAKAAPEGAPINNRGRSGKFKHRVFGHDVWVSQDAHPFFDTPISRRRSDADAAMLAAMDRIARKAGFK